MNPAEVDCLAANTYIELALHASTRSRWQHYATKAEVHSLRARQARGEGYVRSRVFDEIRVAKVRLAQREPAESAAVGIHAVELAAETRSSLVVNLLTRFSRDLAGRHPDVPDVARFREQARNYVRKAAPAMHGRLLENRPEERATLTVLPAATPAQAAYRKWGWRKVAQKRL
jgi:hypothetical protein